MNKNTVFGQIVQLLSRREFLFNGDDGRGQDTRTI